MNNTEYNNPYNQDQERKREKEKIIFDLIMLPTKKIRGITHRSNKNEKSF